MRILLSQTKHPARTSILSERSLKIAMAKLAQDTKYADLGSGKLPRQPSTKLFRV
jgi:hypothetical protein